MHVEEVTGLHVELVACMDYVPKGCPRSVQGKETVAVLVAMQAVCAWEQTCGLVAVALVLTCELLER